LRVFAEAARCGSFTETAASLGTSAATVSRTIAQLEEDICVRLFNRTTRRLQLTDEGRKYLAEVTACLSRLEHAHEELRHVQEHPSGKIRALLQETFCKHYVLPELPDFMKRYPEIEIDIHTQEEGSDLLLGGYDVAVQPHKPPKNSYIFRKLGGVPIILAASPAYLASRGAPRIVADLESHECLRLGNTIEGSMPWTLASRRDPAAVTTYRPQSRCFFSGQFDAVIFAAVNGLGIAPVEVGAAMRYLESDQLKIVLPDYRLVGFELFLIYPHRERLPRRTRVFIDFIAEVAAKRLSCSKFDPHAYAAVSHPQPSRPLRTLVRT
jgi:LysR family transcriptional regulator for bpeEF and oprC